jgi:hypothetical protein
VAIAIGGVGAAVLLTDLNLASGGGDNSACRLALRYAEPGFAGSSDDDQ